MTDIANRVQLSGPKEAEKYVLHMIEDGEIFATINQKDGMVSFEDNPEKYASVAMLSRLDQEVSLCTNVQNTFITETFYSVKDSHILKAWC